MRTSLLGLAVLLSVCGCKGKKGSSEDAPAPVTRCASDTDCSAGWVCLDGKCADPGTGAIYGDPANAVTPDKVKRELEQTGQEHERDLDRSLEAQ